MREEIEVSYNVVHESAGHQKNKKKLKEATKEMFDLVKTKAMQVAVNSVFITFDKIEELEEKLYIAAKDGFNITCYDENLGG